MEDIVEAIFRGLFEIVVEVLIRGPGYLILKLFGSRSQVEPDGCLVFFIGCLVCGMVVGGLGRFPVGDLAACHSL